MACPPKPLILLTFLLLTIGLFRTHRIYPLGRPMPAVFLPGFVTTLEEKGPWKKPDSGFVFLVIPGTKGRVTKALGFVDKLEKKVI